MNQPNSDRVHKRARTERAEARNLGEAAEAEQESFPPPRRAPRTVEETAALIGNVREISNPRCQRLCTHFLKNDCLWGDQCRFSHDAKALRAGAPPTEEMNFSNLEVNQVSSLVEIPRGQLRSFMTESTRRILAESAGITELEWDAELSQATLSGTPAQVEKAEELLRRAITHCKWGVNEAKVQGLLAQEPCTSAKLVLSPMVPGLRQGSFNLGGDKLHVVLGSDASSDLIIRGAVLSRTHVRFELVPSRGALYIVDLSTNGTFLNGVRLPGKASGKVACFHGDELAFPESTTVAKLGEYGYMLNIQFFRT